MRNASLTIGRLLEMNTFFAFILLTGYLFFKLKKSIK